ncbi:MAG: FkbM family methyltransferase [Sneathiellaceae bacterium]
MAEEGAPGTASQEPDPADERRRRRDAARLLEAQGWQALQQAHDMLAGCIEPDGTTGRTRETGDVLPDLWRLARSLEARQQAPRHFSQHGQDAWLDRHVFKGKRDGVFLDIGGYDGVTGSRTLFFELFQGWTGLFFEAVPSYHARAARTRRCPCHCVTIGGADGSSAFLTPNRDRVERRREARPPPHNRERRTNVPVRPVAPFLREAGIRQVDLVSLDIEGSEVEVLDSYPFAEIPVTAWSIENTYASPAIGAALARHGYTRIATIGIDEIYVIA